jgi:hypothetical protein
MESSPAPPSDSLSPGVHAPVTWRAQLAPIRHWRKLTVEHTELHAIATIGNWSVPDDVNHWLMKVTVDWISYQTIETGIIAPCTHFRFCWCMIYWAHYPVPYSRDRIVLIDYCQNIALRVGSVHDFHDVVIKIRQLFLRPAACLTSTLLETGVGANDCKCSQDQRLNVPSKAPFITLHLTAWIRNRQIKQCVAMALRVYSR